MLPSGRGGHRFLDEIGELDGEMQAKLLRVLQERAVVPLGSYDALPIDVCVVAANNRDLAAMVAAGRFREDLYYRLNVLTLKTVALKERPEDIEPLTHHILAKLSCRMPVAVRKLSPSCLTCLRKHAWPGNVRELENFLERALLLTVQLVAPPESPGWDCLSLCPAAAFESASCPGALETSESAAHETQTASLVSMPLSSSFGPGSSDVWPTLANVEREHLQRTLERANYNQQVAADLLGIHRQQLLRKLKKHFIDTSPTRRGRPRKQDHS